MSKRISLLIVAFAGVLLLVSAPDPDQLSAPSLILMDAQSGRVLHEKNGHRSYPPASLTKLMTLYLALSDVRENRIGLDDHFIIDQTGSSFSRPAGSSLMLLEEGQIVTWLELLQGLAISSGNDAAYAVAEISGGSVKDFVSRMNQTAKGLGYDFYFEDPDGWSENNRVTPMGMANFSLHYIKEFPEALNLLHNTLYFDYPVPHNLDGNHSYRINTTRKKRNTNLLLGAVPGVDGLKTGYIEESGFHFIATAKRGKTRLLAVVMGLMVPDFAQGIEQRAREAAALLEYGFNRVRTYELKIPAGLAIPITFGRKQYLSVTASQNPLITLTQEEALSCICIVETDQPFTAPVTSGEVIGSVLFWNSYSPVETDLVAQETMTRFSLIDFFAGE